MNRTPIRAEHYPVFQEIVAEMDRATKLRDAGKFSATCDDHIVAGREGLAFTVLAEEVGEIAKAMNEDAPVWDRREEWKQVAAVATAALMGFDRRYPEGKE